MTLQSTRHEVILNGLLEVTSERLVILHDPSVTSLVLMVKIGRKFITYSSFIIKQLFTYVSVDMECYLTANYTPCPPQHKSKIVYYHMVLLLGVT